MTLIPRIEPVFVKFIPRESDLVLGKIYISRKYETTVHLCADGCGRKVVLPLTPGKWRLDVEAGAVSLFPSVGSWDLPCRSHYWIRDNRVVPARDWSDERVARARERDQRDVDDHFNRVARPKRHFWDWLLGR